MLPLLFLCLTGCEGVYEFKDNPYVKKPVVMSLINPDSLMKVQIWWNKPSGSTGGFDKIEGAAVEITEDGSVVFSGRTDADGVAESSVYPSAGKKYGLRISFDGWPEITASTEIPQPAGITFDTRVKAGGHWTDFILADVKGITAPESAPAVWISTRCGYDDGTWQTGYGDLSSNCAFLDQVNATIDPYDAALRESNIVYEYGFIRIQRSALALAVPFTFSFTAWLSSYSGSHEWGWDEEEGVYVEPTIIYLDKAAVQIVSPSREYDKHHRSEARYLEERSGWIFMSESVNIYSNIANGFGIFAGYNLTEVIVPIDNPQKPQ